MPQRLYFLAAGALLLAGCAAAPPPQPTPQVDTDAIDLLFSNVPLTDSNIAPRHYSPAAGGALEARPGYLVDRSLGARGQNQRVRFIVLHYTGGDERAALRTLTESNVSAHYLVTDNPGRYRDRPVVLQLVDEDRRAWHAGVSQWADRSNLNDTSVGIEIVNPGYHDSPEGQVWTPYSRAQIELVIELTRDLVERYDIEPQNVLGHSDIAPGRKVDPGPFFPWQRLYQAGVGAWPERETVARWQRQLSQAPLSVAQFQRALAAWGYPLAVSGVMDEETRRVVRAFQLHFRPTDTNARMDIESQAILMALLERYQGEAAVRALR
ncbi:N-acetylmuramoyl-L-alanine amidase [Kushneria aurantia]|uniref:N-acetylmuramoyl-L-alanine amidase n=1 Tax=Kushneria aurantia TaxID=504092 RepID=A0ABV6G0K4_9GAMM|nr:N-acetylmuramoyl-L-alanine amidase [Kushneria aurantia]